MATQSASTTPQAQTLTDDECYAAVARRDDTATGRFFYAVQTTGVYCRPNCAARLARRENMSFHLTCEAAESAGFRPCKRCRPNEPSSRARQAELVRKACRMIEEAEELPSLEAIARHVAVSPSHFHRMFKATTGVTPKAYADARRAARLRTGLGAGESVTDAIYGAGYNASSRFYAHAAERLGMAPANFRKGGVDATIRFAIGQCRLGAILVAATQKGVCAITFGDDPDALLRDLQDRFPKANLIGGDADFETLVARVVGFVEAPEQGIDLPLDIRGTAFQERVWQALREIPVGTTTTYAEIAKGIGAPSAVRAVARACASNALAVVIPCHRVVRSDGALSGYRWGVERKRRLLASERPA